MSPRTGARPPLEVRAGFVNAHLDEHGVEPILTTLADTPVGIAPSTYYAAKSRPASSRALADAGLVPVIAKVHAENYGVYGARKVWHQLRREGHDDVARCTVERLMRINGLRGVSKVKTPRTTVPGKDVFPEDRVNRAFTAAAPDQLWVADITCVKTHSGWVYAAFILDMFSRRVVGWRVSTSLHTRLALDALDMALWARRRQGADLSALIHHSNRGVQGAFDRSPQHLKCGGESVGRPVGWGAAESSDRPSRWRVHTACSRASMTSWVVIDVPARQPRIRRA